MGSRGVVVGLTLLVGCGDDGAGKLPDAPAVADAAADAPACPPLGAGTMHAVNITTDAVWSAAASPHIVTTSISIRGGTLTIEPCAVVRLRSGVIITVGQTPGAPAAAISAHGDVDRVITFQRDEATAAWGSLRAFPTGMLDFEHVKLVGGADPATAQQGGGTLIAAGPGGNMGLTPQLRLVDVLIADSMGYGVNVQTRGAFSTDSARLTIMGSTAAPITVEGAAVSTIPSGTYTGNTVSEIRIPNVSNLLDPDIAFHARGLPYHVEGSFAMQPMTTAAAGGLSTLTIEAGVTIKFDANGSLGLGASNGVSPANIAPVRLIAQGTAAAPILLTSALATPTAGAWVGLEWGGGPHDGNVMSHVKIEYAGGDSGTQGFGCG